MAQRLHAVVSGTVQGVAFRWYARIEATRLGLTGTVANRADGQVEVVAEGEPEPLRQFQAWLAIGSPSAEVHEVDVRILPATGEFDAFTVVQFGDMA